MSQTSTERLRDYLAQLPPRSQALLMREFERAIERGEETTIATFVLEQLRKIVRGADADDEARPRTDNPSRLLFRPLEPFLVEGNVAVREGQIRRASLLPVWQWLAREGAPELADQFEMALSRGPENGTSPEIEATARKLQLATAEGLLAAVVSGADDRRALARIGPPDVIEDMPSIACVLQAREAFDTLNSRVPSYMRVFNEAQIESVIAALNVPSLQTPQLLPFVLSLVMQRLAAPWQIIRLAIRMAASDDEMRVGLDALRHRRHHCPARLVLSGGNPAGRYQARSLRRSYRAFENPSRWCAGLANRTRSAQRFGLGQAARIDPRRHFQRAAIGNRQRSRPRQADNCASVPQGHRGCGPDRSGDVEETIALIEFVAVCRTYAGELAINEVTMRTYSDLQHYVEQSTEALVQSLRGSEGKARAYRQTQGPPPSVFVTCCLVPIMRR